MGKIHKFHNLHARVGHLWDTDKADGSEIIVAEIDPHGFMGDLETRQEVAELLASAPRLAEQVRILREELGRFLELHACNDQRDYLAAFDAKHKIPKAPCYRYGFLVRSAQAAMEATKP